LTAEKQATRRERKHINWNNRRIPRWLDRALPHAYVMPGSPLFAYEARGLRWGQDADDLVRRMALRIRLIVGIALGIWAVFMIGMAAFGSDSGWYDALWYAIGLNFILGFLDRFYLDFIAVTISLDDIGRDFDAKRWDLMCLTDISSRNIIRAKYAFAQIKAWRVMSISIGIRLAAVTTTFATLLFTPILFPNNDDIPNIYRGIVETLRGSAGDGFFVVAFITFMFAVFGLYIVEPRWRLKALSAASLAVSSQRRQSTFALLSGFAAVGSIWFCQILLVGVSGFIVFISGQFFLDPAAAGVYILFFIGVFSYALYGLYIGLANYWLEGAYQRIRRMGGAP
jgi:hypothetical protein